MSAPEQARIQQGGLPAVRDVRRSTKVDLVPEQDAVDPGPELTVVVPAFNERDNVRRIVRGLRAALSGRSWEVIFVDDDSPDGTHEVVREFGRKDERVRCLRRIGRRGLSSACIEGMLASTAPYLAVMDGDLQHDEKLLPRMLDTLKSEDIDIVIGSRHAPGGSLGDWHASRARISHLATRLSRTILRAPLSDPMSGLFMVRSDAFLQRVHSLSGIGFKILLDLFASGSQPLRFREIPYQFRGRQFGDSKLDSRAAWDFVMLLLDKLLGRALPIRFVTFALVGSLGVGVHLAAMVVLLKGGQISFAAAQAGATLIAMTSNFALNNAFTYRDRRLRGWQWLRGWATFVLACSVGGIANVGISAYLFEANNSWLPASLAGTIVGSVWNYVVTSVYTWRTRTST
jgi:dolichol-phosphate mannosyltransferase